MKSLPMLLITALLLAAGCGEEKQDPAADAQAPAAGVEREGDDDAGPARSDDDAKTNQDNKAATPRRRGTPVTVANSEFGEMLFDSNEQAIYIFENDPKGESVCYDECAEAWPPVFTDGPPVAGPGVKASLLGTVKRRDGKLQVAYADKPLYYYAHEGPGEVRCHNVNLNGGLWWVVGSNGKRRP
jgi:predicted lipoprotein with Yx(FWY)xxD motif